jgi:hypothetical protein
LLTGLNVRFLLNNIRLRIQDIAIRLLFNPNDLIVREQFTQQVNEYLTNVFNNRGILKFRLVVDGDNPADLDAKSMYAKLYVTPTNTLEEIGVGLIIAPNSVRFE